MALMIVFFSTVQHAFCIALAGVGCARLVYGLYKRRGTTKILKALYAVQIVVTVMGFELHLHLMLK